MLDEEADRLVEETDILEGEFDADALDEESERLEEEWEDEKVTRRTLSPKSVSIGT